MKVRIFANYGVLGHEKVPVYSVSCPCTEAYDELIVELPDQYFVGQNMYGNILVEIDNETYEFARMLKDHDGVPALAVFEYYRYKYIDLKIVEGE